MNKALNAPFEPNWASPPWNTIEELLNERGMMYDELIDKLGLDWDGFHSLVKGSLVIDQPLAEKLHILFGASAQFWLNRDKQYRESLARILSRKKPHPLQ